MERWRNWFRSCPLWDRHQEPVYQGITQTFVVSYIDFTTEYGLGGKRSGHLRASWDYSDYTYDTKAVQEAPLHIVLAVPTQYGV